MIEITLLVLPPAFAQEGQPRVVAAGSLAFTQRHTGIQSRQVATGEMVGDISRCELEDPVAISHAMSLDVTSRSAWVPLSTFCLSSASPPRSR
jgi:hypothetical protein